MKLNLGCGATKIDGYINIDVEESCNPDVVHDFTKAPLPFEANKISEVLLFHTIEHISKRYHRAIIGEIWRVLEPNGVFLVSFPEFRRCAENWMRNEGGKKDFWEATLYGRQLYPSDFHVALMDSHEFSVFLKKQGFNHVVARPEPNEPFNSFIVCSKGEMPKDYNDMVLDDMKAVKLLIKQ